MGTPVPGALGVALCRARRAQVAAVVPCRARWGAAGGASPGLAKTAAREASLVAKRAQQGLAQSVASAEVGATAASSPSTRPQGVASQRPRPRNDAFFKGIVACMASAPRVDFSSALATAVVETACALLSSERPATRQADVLSVEAA